MIAPRPLRLGDTIRRISRARIPGSTALVDITLQAGRVESVTPALSRERVPGGDIDAVGRLVVSAFTESHLHLDKAMLGSDPAASDLAGAIAATSRRKAAFTAGDIRQRAVSVLRAASRTGTTAVRAQTEVDPGIGLLGVDTIADLADTVAGAVRVQLAVFPQEGILIRPGTLELMREALRTPGAVVGGCPYAEPELEAARRHIDIVLDLAAELDRGVDLHLDLADSTDDPRFTLAEYVAGAVKARSLERRVAISHASTLGALDDDRRARTLDALAEACVTVVLLPSTDLYLNGRTSVPAVRGLPIVKELWARGVPVTVSSNNVQNAFTPTGRSSLLDMALLLARVSHLSAPAEFDRVMEMVTCAAQKLLWPGSSAGLQAGGRADLVVLDAADPFTAVNDDSARLAVISGGVLVAHEERRTTSII